MKYVLGLLLILSLNAQADNLTVGLLGLTYHGVSVDTQGSDAMTRKLTDNGMFVWNPEINLTLEKKGLIYNVTLVNDCFGNDAYHIGFGKKWHLTDTFSFGAMGGIYARPHPEAVKIMPDWMRHGYWDIIPMPWLIVQQDFPFSQTSRVSLQATTNYALSHIVLGFSQDF